MIDTHCHIIPGIDDGAGTIEDAIRMAKVAVHNGIHTIFATPHHAKRNYYNPANGIRAESSRLQQQLDDRGISLRILPGQEFHVHADYINDYQAGNIQLMGMSRYLLVELPDNHVPDFFLEFVSFLLSKGITPVVAHPERNKQLAEHPFELFNWLEHGVYFQVTASSVLGLNGPKAREAAITMCHNRWIQLIASDAHNTTTRGFHLREALLRVGSEVGRSTVDNYILNGNLLLESNRLAVDDPVNPVRKKQFWVF